MNLKPVRAHAPLVRRALGVAVLGVAVLMIYGVDRDLRTRVPEYTKALQSARGERARRSTELERPRRQSGHAREERARRLRPRARLRRHRGVGQLAAADARGAARQGRPARLLDVLVHQLPAHAPAHPRWDDDVPRRRPGDRRRAHARVRLRARARQRARAPSATSESPTRSRSTTSTAPGRRSRTGTGPPSTSSTAAGTSATSTSARATTRRASASSATLLAEDASGPLVSDEIEDETPSGEQTPETYLGYQRARPLRRLAARCRTGRREYSIPKFVPLHGVAYGGRWTVEDERIVAGQQRPAPARFHARNVFLVLGGRRAEDGRRSARRRAGRTVQRDAGRPLHAGAHPGREARPRRSTSASRRAPRPTPSRSARRLPRGSWRVRSSCSLRKRVSSAASESPGRDVELLAERVAALSSSCTYASVSSSCGDRLAHLELVGVGRPLEVGEVERGAEQRRQALAERVRGLWAGRERHVVRHRRPEARRGYARRARQASWRTPTMPVGPS